MTCDHAFAVVVVRQFGKAPLEPGRRHYHIGHIERWSLNLDAIAHIDKQRAF